MNTINRSFTTYNGGKSGNGTYQQIINLIPKMVVYIEPMVGGGGVFNNLKLPSLTILNDVDSYVISRYIGNVGPGIICENICALSVIAKYDGATANTFFYLDDLGLY